MKTAILYFLVIGNIAFSLFLMSKIEAHSNFPMLGIVGELKETEINATLKEIK